MTLVESNARGSEFGKRSLARLASLLAIVVVGMAHAAPSTGSASASNVPTTKQAGQQAQLVAALQMTEVDWHKGGFNNMMLLNATVRNSGKRDVKDIKVVCDHLSHSETKIDSNAATIYGPFPAGRAKSIREFDMGAFHDQAKGTNCSIVDATVTTKRWGRAPR